MSDDATITRYPQAVEETPTMVLRFIERAMKDHPRVALVGLTNVLVLQQQWKVRDIIEQPMGRSGRAFGDWRFEWRDVPLDPHGGS